MCEITLQVISVMSDGGTREGRMILADGHVVAIFTQVTVEDTAGDEHRAEGWFLEAGFGPCSNLMTITPPIFDTLEQAVEWVCFRLETGLASP
jgi:hypothetical protein